MLAAPLWTRERGWMPCCLLVGVFEMVTAHSGGPAAFAFMYRFAELEPGSPAIDEDALASLALRTITSRIDSGAEVNGIDHTYELRAGEWVAVEQPRWWVPAFDQRPGR